VQQLEPPGEAMLGAVGVVYRPGRWVEVGVEAEEQFGWVRFRSHVLVSLAAVRVGDIGQVRRVRGSPGTLRSLGAAAAPLIGRAVEREAIERWLGRVATGQAARALIEGEAGIGKTRLADASRTAALGLSVAVLMASADELDRGRPFGLLADALGFCPRGPRGFSGGSGVGIQAC
jgi:hypothetical protein